ncbi:MAG: nuclear transport factor 2 family protein [Bdellovibrionales bacterium]|nr:nuclear transport factor 2 family protein [Bdellovibrionales bacterium]
MKQIYKDYVALFERLDHHNLEELRLLTVSNFHFVDPFHDVWGIDNTIAIFAKMYDWLSDPDFKVLGLALADEGLYVRWSFRASGKRLLRGRIIEFEGMSLVREENGLICEHLDYWDASQLFRIIPIFGGFLRRLTKLI